MLCTHQQHLVMKNKPRGKSRLRHKARQIDCVQSLVVVVTLRVLVGFVTTKLLQLRSRSRFLSGFVTHNTTVLEGSPRQFSHTEFSFIPNISTVTDNNEIYSITKPDNVIFLKLDLSNTVVQIEI